MYSYLSLHFIYDLFPHLLRILIPSFSMQIFINMPSSYCRLMDNFSGLIEFIPGIIWSLVYTLHTQVKSLDFRQLISTLCVILWSLRLGGFLVYRMLISGPLDTRIENLAKKHGRLAVLGFWLGPHAFWSLICCLPVALVHTFPLVNMNVTILDFIGSIFWISGFVMETLADGNKLKAKLVNKQKYYHLGTLWNYSRNPNHCGEVFSWLGLSIIALNLVFYHPLYRYNIFIIILSLISPLFTLCVMLFEATLASEIKNNQRFKNQSDYHQYRKQTSILWPIPPQLYLRLPKWIRKIIFFEFDLYNKGLKQRTN